jgi:hypothetical protein
MCCCDKPNVNGQPGYRWQPEDKPSIRQPYPPELEPNDVLLHDEPGRCGGIDCHCHHYRLVRQHSCLYLLTKHGGGVERIRLSRSEAFIATLAVLDSDQRYWILHTIYHAQSDSARNAAEKASATWQRAAAEKRIKTQKVRNSERVKVWIETTPIPAK